MGHPPFGHNGEKALDSKMRDYGGFEGNAQSLRIVSVLEKKIYGTAGQRLGLGLCYRTLASIIKYDNKIPTNRKGGAKVVKGYYGTEADLVTRIKDAVLCGQQLKDKKFKTIECSIMDIADDIAYSTFDLEDSFKADFLSPANALSSSNELLDAVAKKVSNELGYDFTGAQTLLTLIEIFDIGSPIVNDGDHLRSFIDRFKAYERICKDAHYRTKLSSDLINRAINEVSVDYDDEFPMLSTVKLGREAKERVEVLKHYTYLAAIYSPRVKVSEYRGQEVVEGIFHALTSDRGELLMPEDVKQQYELSSHDVASQMRIVCDYIAGMTDRYSVEFYGRLHSDSAATMFKPH